MILASKAGFLFRSTEKIKQDYPQLPAYETYDELLRRNLRCALICRNFLLFPENTYENER